MTQKVDNQNKSKLPKDLDVNENGSEVEKDDDEDNSIPVSDKSESIPKGRWIQKI